MLLPNPMANQRTSIHDTPSPRLVRNRFARRALAVALLSLVVVSCASLEDELVLVELAALPDGGVGPSPLGVGGTACSKLANCPAGQYCVDGVCCTSLCSKPCESCNAATKQSGTGSGTCGPRALGELPRTPCSLIQNDPCQVQACNGLGYCGQPPGTLCGSQQACTVDEDGRWAVSQQKCMDTGHCGLVPTLCANHLACDPGQNECFAECTSSAQCRAGYYCRNGGCLPKVANGNPCNDAEQCTSGICYLSNAQPNGVCCSDACTGDCFTCFGGQQESPTDHGQCRPTRNEKDYDDVCMETADPCTGPGYCDGKGKCAVNQKDTHACGPTTCEEEEVNGVPAAVVGGMMCISGECVLAEATTCSNGVAECAGDVCAPTCTSDDGCQPEYYCDSESQCAPRLGNGEHCDSNSACITGFCADGYCCDAECARQCEACDRAGALGKCGPVTGAPHGERPPCDQLEPGAPCSQLACDGTNPDACEGYVGDQVKCGAGGCSEGSYGSVKQPDSHCDGNGTCMTPDPVHCAAATCAGCGSKCTTEREREQCVDGAVCDVLSGGCTLGSRCASEGLVARADGRTESCEPYRCHVDRCREQCDSNEDCVTGALCDAKTRTCALPATESDPGAPGCSCRSGAPSSRMPLWLAGVLGLVLLRRRTSRRLAHGGLSR